MASWGGDLVKLDGISEHGSVDVKARVPGPDIECYSYEPSSTSGMPHPGAFPLTTCNDPADSFHSGVWWQAGAVGRFYYAARWARHARPGGFNDLDSG